MGLNAYQQAVSDLAHRLGLKGAAEQQVYSRPEYQQLLQQLYGNIPLPAGVDPSQVITNTPALLEYKDADGYVHRLERDLVGTSSSLGQVKETSSNRPPILPPSPQQTQAEKAISTGLLGNLAALFGIPGVNTSPTGTASPSPLGSGRTVGTLTGGTSPGQGSRTLGNLTSNQPQLPTTGGINNIDPYRQTPAPPGVPDISSVINRLNNLPSPPQMPDFGALQGQLSGAIGAPPGIPDLSAITGGLNNLSGSYNQVFNQLMQAPQLANLQSGDLANLAAIKAASDAQLAKQQSDLQGSLVSQLYGRGINQSNIANQAGANFAESMGRLQLQANADAASRQLGLQQFLTQQGQGNLALAGQTLGQQGQSLYQQGQLGLGQGQLALGGYEAQNNANLQRLGLLANSLFQQGNLGLNAYQTNAQTQLQAAQQTLAALLGQGQLALGSYQAGQGVESDRLSQAMNLFNLINNLDLNRQVQSGQLGLGQAQLAQQANQFQQSLSQQQEQLRLQERLARGSLFDQIMRGVGAAVSIGAAPFTGGASLFGLAGLGGGGGGKTSQLPTLSYPSI